jgi:hypothetical protein
MHRPLGLREPAVSARASLRGYGNLAPLHARAFWAGGLLGRDLIPPPSVLAAQLGCLLLAGAQGLFALPQRYGEHLAALTIDEEIDPLKALHFLETGHDVLLGVAEAFIYLVRRTLVGGYARKHVASFIPVLPTRVVAPKVSKPGCRRYFREWSFHALG